jgi:hypothetical protein
VNVYQITRRHIFILNVVRNTWGLESPRRGNFGYSTWRQQYSGNNVFSSRSVVRTGKLHLRMIVVVRIRVEWSGVCVCVCSRVPVSVWVPAQVTPQ